MGSEARGSQSAMAKKEAQSEASSVVSDLINFLNVSPTAFHAVGKYYIFLSPFSTIHHFQINVPGNEIYVYYMLYLAHDIVHD